MDFGFVTDFVEKFASDSSKDIAAANNRGKVTPEGKTENGLIPKIQAPSLSALSSNPIVNMGADLINEVVGSVVQDMVRSALKKTSKGLRGIEDATGSFFMVLALASTAQVEFLMELARGNARLITQKLVEKDKLIEQMAADIAALNNAISLLLNSQPFFGPYLQQLLKAYSLIDDGDRKLKSVVATLKGSHFYNDKLYATALSRLQQAEDLMLPDRSASVSEIRSGNFTEGTAGITNSKKALAAALTIPGISANIGRNFVNYATLTLEIDALIELFCRALSDYIAGYQRGSSIDQTTLDHIDTATAKLDELLGSMGVVLFPSDGRESSATYPSQVVASATSWSVTLAPVIEWLRVEPGRASKQLDLTGESVRRYNTAVAALLGMGEVKYGLAVLDVKNAEENIVYTAKAITKILATANTVIATRRVPDAVRAELRSLGDLMVAAKHLDSDIRTALTPFINTPNNLTAGAAGVVGNVSKLASSLGLDRASSFLSTCNISGLLAMTPGTSTFVGAAVAGLGSLLKSVKSNPAATDQDAQAISDISDSYNRTQAVKKIEAARSSTDTAASFVAAQSAQTASIKQQARKAAAIATKYNVDGVQGATQLNSIKSTVAGLTGSTFNLL